MKLLNLKHRANFIVSLSVNAIVMCSLLSPPTFAWNIEKLTFYISPYFWYIVKNRFHLFDDLFISADAYTQVLLTRLTFIDKMQLLLKPYIFDKFLLDTFHSWDTKKVFCTWVERERVCVDVLDSFLSLPNYKKRLFPG